jgi:hypothetical protein
MSIMVAAGLALEVRRTRQVRRTVPLVAAGA